MPGGEILKQIEQQKEWGVTKQEFEKTVNDFKSSPEKRNEDAKEIMKINKVKDLVIKNCIPAALKKTKFTEEERVSILLAKQYISDDVDGKNNTDALKVISRDNGLDGQFLVNFINNYSVTNTIYKGIGKYDPSNQDIESKEEASTIKFKSWHSSIDAEWLMDDKQLTKLDKIESNKVVVFEWWASNVVYTAGEKVETNGKTKAENDYTATLNLLEASLGKTTATKINAQVTKKISQAKDVHETANWYLAITRAINCSLWYLEKVEASWDQELLKQVKEKFKDIKFDYKTSVNTDVKIYYEEKETVVIDPPMNVDVNITFSTMKEQNSDWTRHLVTVNPDSDTPISNPTGIVKTGSISNNPSGWKIKPSARQEWIYTKGKLDKVKEIALNNNYEPFKIGQNFLDTKNDTNLKLHMREYSQTDFMKEVGAYELDKVWKKIKNGTIISEVVKNTIENVKQQLTTYWLDKRNVLACEPNYEFPKTKMQKNVIKRLDELAAKSSGKPNYDDFSNQLTSTCNRINSFFVEDENGKEDIDSPTSGRNKVFKKLEPDYMKKIDEFRSQAFIISETNGGIKLPTGPELYDLIYQSNVVKFNDNIRALQLQLRTQMNGIATNAQYSSQRENFYTELINKLEPFNKYSYTSASGIKVDFDNFSKAVVDMESFIQTQFPSETTAANSIFLDKDNGVGKNESIIKHLDLVRKEKDKASDLKNKGLLIS